MAEAWACLRALLYCGLGWGTPPLHRISGVNYSTKITLMYKVAVRPAHASEGGFGL